MGAIIGIGAVVVIMVAGIVVFRILSSRSDRRRQEQAENARRENSSRPRSALPRGPILSVSPRGEGHQAAGGKAGWPNSPGGDECYG